MKRVALVLGFCLVVPTPSLAQAAWDAPYSDASIGRYGTALLAGRVERGGFGIVGVHERATSFGDISLRLGLVDENGKVSFPLGAYLASQIASKDAMSISWLAGLGATLGGDEEGRVAVPVGLRVGFDLGSADAAFQFQPFLAPRISFDVLPLDMLSDVRTALDVGTDVALANRWFLRFAYSIQVGARVGGSPVMVGVGLRDPGAPN